jgi:hypothetical protein
VVLPASPPTGESTMTNTIVSLNSVASIPVSAPPCDPTPIPLPGGGFVMPNCSGLVNQLTPTTIFTSPIPNCYWATGRADAPELLNYNNPPPEYDPTYDGTEVNPSPGWILGPHGVCQGGTEAPAPPPSGDPTI